MKPIKTLGKSVKYLTNKPIGALEGIGNVTAQGAKTTDKTLNFLGSGLKRTPKNATLGEKVYGTTVKGVALGGAGYGGYKALDRFTKGTGSSPSKYTINTRNRVLSGDLDIRDLSKEDKRKVSRLL